MPIILDPNQIGTSPHPDLFKEIRRVAQEFSEVGGQKPTGEEMLQLTLAPVQEVILLLAKQARASWIQCSETLVQDISAEELYAAVLSELFSLSPLVAMQLANTADELDRACVDLEHQIEENAILRAEMRDLQMEIAELRTQSATDAG